MNTQLSLSGSGSSGQASGAAEKPAEALVVRRVEGTSSAGEASGGNAPAVVVGYAVMGEAEAAALLLSPAQRRAIERLTSGSTVVEAAAAAGVGRTTLYRWLKEDPAFIAAFNAWQRDIVATTRARVLALTASAATALDKAMSRGDGWLAYRVLERTGMMDRPTPGATEVEEVKREQELEARRAEAERRKAAAEVTSKEQDVMLLELCHPPEGMWEKGAGKGKK